MTEKLTSADLAVILRFAKQGGIRWKAKLRRAWESGDYGSIEPDNKAHLQSLRNRFGTSLLSKFRAKL